MFQLLKPAFRDDATFCICSRRIRSNVALHMLLFLSESSYRTLFMRLYVTAALRDLHWLPVAHRIEFNMCLVHKTLVGHSPEYLSDLPTPAATWKTCTSNVKRRRLYCATYTTATPQVQWESLLCCWSPVLEHADYQRNWDNCTRHQHLCASCRHFNSPLKEPWNWEHTDYVMRHAAHLH